ncbi:MAG: glycosyltransferase [Proteobacteria bacterium]|nr:glycosyltransferase [Pseudomonadota bacterium]
MTPQASGGSPPLSEHKESIRRHFDAIAPDRALWRDKNLYYYAYQEKMLKFLVPENARVLELGCGAGDLLAALKPSRGVGVDLSPAMIEKAKEKFPHLSFVAGDMEDPQSWAEQAGRGPFDFIVIADTIGLAEDVQTLFERLQPFCNDDTRLIVTYYNVLWEPVLRLAERFGAKMPQPELAWLSLADMENLLSLADFEIVKMDSRLLVPKAVPGLNRFLDFLGSLPVINRLCVSNYLVARRVAVKPIRRKAGVTVVIPCKNERGNIEDAVRRVPDMGTHTQIIFVDGHSADGTPAEIRRVMAAYPEKDILFLVQDGKGKGDAVRKGFDAATQDILMILDADLTVPPEDLPKFHDAIVRDRGEFINGSRLVYPLERMSMRFLNILGNKFFGLAFSWLLNQRIKDTLCGTKVLTRDHYRAIADGRDFFGDFDPFGDFDLLFGAAKGNMRIKEVPIRYKARQYGETQISRFAHGWLLLRMCWFAMRKIKLHG